MPASASRPISPGNSHGLNPLPECCLGDVSANPSQEEDYSRCHLGGEQQGRGLLLGARQDVGDQALIPTRFALPHSTEHLLTGVLPLPLLPVFPDQFLDDRFCLWGRVEHQAGTSRSSPVIRQDVLGAEQSLVLQQPQHIICGYLADAQALGNPRVVQRLVVPLIELQKRSQKCILAAGQLHVQLPMSGEKNQTIHPNYTIPAGTCQT